MLPLCLYFGACPENWMAGILNWHREVDRYKADHLARRAHGFLPDRASAIPVGR